MTGLAEPVLLLSPDGMLGRAWHELLEREDIRYQELIFPAFDLTNRESLAEALSGPFATVINCSAFTDVDGAEKDVESATAINGTGSGWLAEICQQQGALLIHYSTDYVFNGQAESPYATDHPIEPINAYGHSKALGERLIRQAGSDHLIVRTSWLYAPWANNFVVTMARLTRERDELRVVADQRGRPTSAERLAYSTLLLARSGARGTHHLTDGGECTWYDFASAIAEHLDATCRIEPCTTDEFPRPARRPGYSVLDLAESESLIGTMPSWRDNLADVLDRLQ